MIRWIHNLYHYTASAIFIIHLFTWWYIVCLIARPSIRIMLLLFAFEIDYSETPLALIIRFLSKQIIRAYDIYRRHWAREYQKYWNTLSKNLFYADSCRLTAPIAAAMSIATLILQLLADNYASSLIYFIRCALLYFAWRFRQKRVFAAQALLRLLLRGIAMTHVIWLEYIAIYIHLFIFMLHLTNSYASIIYFDLKKGLADYMIIYTITLRWWDIVISETRFKRFRLTRHYFSRGSRAL